MSAIVDTAVSTGEVLVKGTAAELTFTAATQTGTLVTDTETFDITPIRDDSRLAILVKNASGATVKVSVLKGDMWASTADLTAFDVATAKLFVLTIETAKYRGSDGKINVKITPTAGTALTAVDDVSITYIEV